MAESIDLRLRRFWVQSFNHLQNNQYLASHATCLLLSVPRTKDRPSLRAGRSMPVPGAKHQPQRNTAP